MNTPSADLFQLAFDASPTGKLVVDEAGTIVLANRETARLFGYELGELIGLSVEALVPARYRSGHPTVRRAFHQAPQSRPMGAGRDLFGMRKDGTELPIEIGLNPVHTPDGVIILATVVDISARRALEGQLRQAQKLEALGTLAGGIAHDFNNLLRSIVGYSELAAGAITDPQALADLEQVRVAAARGQELVLRMLAFSRPSDATTAPVSLSDPAREAVALLRSTIPSLIEIRYRGETDAPPVRIDPTQFQQVLMNLVTNAAQAIGDTSGSIDVTLSTFTPDDAFTAAHSTSSQGPHIRVSVADSGPGMSDDVQRRAFEPFFTTKPVGKGTGLGLSMVHGIVHGAGGALELQSRPGAGTTVHIYLPAVVPDAAQHVAPDPAEPTAPHVLFVDDEEVIMELSRRQLVNAGFRVTAFSSSLQALEAFRRDPDAFSLVVTDNTMPKLPGLQLAREVLALRPQMPVLLVSGLVDTLAPEVIYQKGIAGLLRKPHTGAQLVAAARALTDRTRLPSDESSD
jgi:PAS domain S-box-containing protein